MRFIRRNLIPIAILTFNVVAIFIGTAQLYNLAIGLNTGFALGDTWRMKK